jgi:hypothetical protein
MDAAVKKNLLKYPIIFLFWSALESGSNRFIPAWGSLCFTRSMLGFFRMADKEK